jgi:hypothetical protein
MQVDNIKMNVRSAAVDNIKIKVRSKAVDNIKMNVKGYAGGGGGMERIHLAAG